MKNTILNDHNLFRVAAVSPTISVANPSANAKSSIRAIDSVDADLIVLPELGLTGYTCGDLFATDALMTSTLLALGELVSHSESHDKTIVAGLPLRVCGSLMNTAAVIFNGKVRAVVPKTFLPTYREFYEGRHFAAASNADPSEIKLLNEIVPFGTDLIVQRGDAKIAVEICEDFWTPIPPSSHAALAGANVLVNLSSSNETIGKAGWRRDLVRSQSGRCIAAYVYCSSGPSESTSDLVFGGHCLIAENGAVLGESRRVGDGETPSIAAGMTNESTSAETSVARDIDLGRLIHDRQVVGSFDDGRHASPSFRTIDLGGFGNDGQGREPRGDLLRRIDAHPFVPDESTELELRCAEIFDIQTAGLCKRLSRLGPTTKLSIGVSGGLDSTLALLVAIRACDSIGKDRKDIVGITMPGFGTTSMTKSSAETLIETTGITRELIDIRQLCLDTFLSLNHSPLGIPVSDSTDVESLQAQLQKLPDDAKDLTFENVQARVRTMLLMNRGFVLGTGDMSEQALGWSTYNADHMSMYNVNTSIPKTLVRFLVRYAADHYFDGELRSVLHDIANTTISPELLPPREDGTIRQSTEESIGAYELHDFFLFHFVRNGFSRNKILYLASHAKFDQDYSPKHIAETLDIFVKRFFFSQYKRNCVPDGPKVGSVSLSPRGDWRMPSDANAGDFL
ncbi:Glutamine-dependent NAD(+) synthetase [Rubripirellula obstinata]|uniref:Glutamine-dependent NAD(+) synthetase n=1 Tax=Rubripirellula obstinata TaxID=406547 RepID=A0A5B1CD55_9BACT|nr:NAD(+) synthase [Rubripirellula obstinata]KAA1257885.1 Glutamine-dependent NAD(+) synthetase [Rubripirellula obstinata]